MVAVVSEKKDFLTNPTALAPCAHPLPDCVKAPLRLPSRLASGRASSINFLVCLQVVALRAAAFRAQDRIGSGNHGIPSSPHRSLPESYPENHLDTTALATHHARLLRNPKVVILNKRYALPAFHCSAGSTPTRPSPVIKNVLRVCLGCVLHRSTHAVRQITPAHVGFHPKSPIGSRVGISSPLDLKVYQDPADSPNLSKYLPALPRIAWRESSFPLALVQVAPLQENAPANHSVWNKLCVRSP